jgi:hypothetical protein
MASSKATNKSRQILRTPYDHAQIGDRYDHPHRRVRSEAAGSNLEKTDVFWRTHPPVATSFADVQSQARPRRDEAVRQRVKAMPIPQVGKIGSVWQRSFVLADYRSRCPSLMAFPNIPIRELHIVPCRLTAGYVSDPADQTTLEQSMQFDFLYCGPILWSLEETPQSRTPKPKVRTTFERQSCAIERHNSFRCC